MSKSEEIAGKTPAPDGVDAKSELGAKNKKPKALSDTKGDNGKLNMPSQQAAKLTKAYNKLVEIRSRGDVEGVILAAVGELQKELQAMNNQLLDVHPKTDAQRRTMETWITKNVAHKAEFLAEVLDALQEERNSEQDRRSRQTRQSRRSGTSSARRAAEAAAEDELRLLEEQQQLRRVQEACRRQQEEEAALQDQRERNELQRRIEEARQRRAELEEIAENDSSVVEFPLHVPRLPQVQQPTPAWLEAAQVNPRARPTEPLITRAEEERATSTPLTSLMQHLLLAQAQLPKFKGDPLNYLWFRKAFQTQVESMTPDPERKLYMLLQQLDGEPHALVKACQLASDPGVGFQRAMKLLQDRCGHPVQQALAFKTQLFNWPTVKEPEDLAKFSVHLQLCREMQTNAGQLKDLDAASVLLQLAKKLPSKLRNAWQIRVVDIETMDQRETTFEDFAKFVARHEKARNHPVFGSLAREGSAEPASRTSSKVKVFRTEALQPEDPDVAAQETHQEQTALATTNHNVQGENMGDKASTDRSTKALDAFKAPCLFCEGPHTTSKCTKELDREEKKAKLRGLCFACLKPGHSARSCKFRLKCDKCKGLHPTVLHEDRPVDAQMETNKKERPAIESTTVEQSMATTSSFNRFAAIATVPVRLRAHGQKESVLARAILDSASTATFISNALADQLGLDCRATSLDLATMHGEAPSLNAKMVYGLQVSDYHDNTCIDIEVAYAVQALPPVDQHLNEDQLQQWPHLTDIDFLWDETPSEALLLIGQNVKDALKPLEVRDGPGNTPYAVRTALGWALHGPLGDVTCVSRPKETVSFTQARDIHIKLDLLYYRDFEGAYDFVTKSFSREENDWLAAARESIQRTTEGRFVVSLPMKVTMLPSLHNNYDQARQRLRGLLKKFAANPAFKEDYVAFVQKMLSSGYVEEVVEPLANHRLPGVNYVPHHGVYHPRKPGKIRVVFNCASKFRGVALNDCLRCGPDLTSSIVGVLLRFRQFKVAFMADIEAMFYRVLVPEHQRNLLRFLWCNDAGEERIYRLKVHLFGATSSPAVANFALRHAADEALTEGVISKDVAQAVHQNFYVDDCLKSAPTLDQAVRLAHGLVRACRYGGFNLGKFVSSSVKLLRTLDKAQLAKDLADVDLNDVKTDPLGSLQERALGVAWNVASDCFVFRLGKQLGEARAAGTRRELLSRLSQVYDPLGFAAPVVIVARVQFRRLTTAAADAWDTALPEQEIALWARWLESLSHVPALS